MNIKKSAIADFLITVDRSILIIIYRVYNNKYDVFYIKIWFTIEPEEI